MARILIIDDDGELRRMLRMALEEAGHQVVEAADGARGIDAHRRRAAELVLCDIVMPEREGLETIRELRAWDPGVPILAMSGGAFNGTMDFLPTAAKLGASATLHKPFAVRALLGVVGELLGRQDEAAATTKNNPSLLGGHSG